MDVGKEYSDRSTEVLKDLKRFCCIFRLDDVKPSILERKHDKLADQCIIFNNNNNNGHGGRFASNVIRQQCALLEAQMSTVTTSPVCSSREKPRPDQTGKIRKILMPPAKGRGWETGGVASGGTNRDGSPWWSTGVSFIATDKERPIGSFGRVRRKTCTGTRVLG
jgi:hypothetical protein